MQRHWRYVAVIGLVLLGGSGLSSRVSAAPAELEVTPNPVNAGESVIIGNASGPANTCAPPSVVSGEITSEGESVIEFGTDPDADGNWQFTVYGGELAPGSYVVTATCDALISCDDGGLATACVPCPDGSTATSPGNCPPPIEPCPGDGVAPPDGSCDPCPGDPSILVGNLANCPVMSTTIVPPAAAVDPPAVEVEEVAAPTEAAPSFAYESATFEVVGGVVTARPPYTG